VSPVSFARFASFCRASGWDCVFALRGTRLRKEEDAAAWSNGEPLPQREEEITGHLEVARCAFEKWLPGDSACNSFRYGAALEEILRQRDANREPWFVFCDLMAEATGADCHRVCPSFSTSDICALLERHGGMQMADTPDHLGDEQFKQRRRELRGMPVELWPEPVTTLLSEIVAVQSQFVPDGAVEVTGLDDEEADGDDGERLLAAESMLNAANGLEAGACGPSNDDQRAPSAKDLKRMCQEAPRMSPPDLDTTPVPENTPGYIPMAFPKLFPFGTGDYHDPEAPFKGKVDFGTWGRTIMQWHDGRFMRHTRFRYWFLNTWLRMKTPGARQVFYRVHENMANLTLAQLRSHELRLKVVQQMATAASNIPGTMGERRTMRQRLESMVDQKEAETVEEYETLGRGRLPAAFATLTCSVYKWAQLHDVLLRSYPSAERQKFEAWRKEDAAETRCEKRKEAYYRAALANPGVVEWYCALRLEMSVRLVAALLTQSMQQAADCGTYKDTLRKELQRYLGDTFDETSFQASFRAMGRVDDFWASFEWSSGGMVHVHVAFWITGSPRVDKVVAQSPHGATPDDGDRDGGREILLDDDGDVVLTDAQCANLMASFYDPAYTEWHLGKDPDGAAAKAPSARHDLGKGCERKVTAPDMLSHDALMWLLDCPRRMHALTSGAAQREVLETIDGVPQKFAGDRGHEVACGDHASEASDRSPGRHVVGPSSDNGCLSQRLSTRPRAHDRDLFVTKLVDWSQMHDYHAPFPHGPPHKDQPCAKVENEHSAMERAVCGKLFPRKLIQPGCEEVSEDPRRRELYRVWLARNCHFVNNYMPVALLACHCNMDIQATLTKTGVVEYMTKYMTKSGMGSLIGLMERSFAICIDKAREEGKEAGSAMLRWFNLTSMAEVKSQLETMHLCFQLPRSLCSRDFRRLAVKSEYKKLRDIGELHPGLPENETLTLRGPAEVYLARRETLCPEEAHLHEPHPITGQPLWAFIADRLGGTRPSDWQGHLSQAPGGVQEHVLPDWKRFVMTLSWWEFRRLFNNKFQSLRFKPKADILVVSPAPRLAKASKDDSWYESCRMALLAYCNHGPPRIAARRLGNKGQDLSCSPPFGGLADLQGLSHEALEAQLRTFVEATNAERNRRGMCPCPPFLRRSWRLGMLRQARHAAARRSKAATVRSLPSPSVAAPPVARSWAVTPTAAMSAEQQEEARAAWSIANAEDDQRIKETIAENSGEQHGSADCQQRMLRSMRKRLQWRTGDLHDALCHLGGLAPGRPSDLGYFACLLRDAGEAEACQQPQNGRSHTVAALKRALTFLGGHGGLKGKKSVLGQRLATILDSVVQAGRDNAQADAVNREAEEEGGAGYESGEEMAREDRGRVQQEWDHLGPS
jgi:hypothetical protein